MRRAGAGSVMAAWLMVLVGRAGGALAGADEPRPYAVALEQRAYVWQRVWTEPLSGEIREHAREFGALDVLGAEIRFTDDRAVVENARPNWELLKGVGVPVSLVVRIGPRKRSWGEAPGEVEAVVERCRVVVQRARAARVEVAELQIDFDAATSQLADYAGLLRRVREELRPMRLVATALPSWLASPEFAEVARAVDAYVLQVHSLEKPRGVADAVTLFDAAKARRWIESATRLGRPFRVALPAYGYRVGFARDGRFLGLEAEGAARAWPADAITRDVWADAGAVAGLVAELRAKRPAACEGLSWFRFPSANDERAWRWATLRSVMRGVAPRGEVVVRLVAGEAGTVDLVMSNVGADRATGSGQRITWRGGAFVAGDGIDGWRVERRGAHEIVLSPSEAGAGLRAGESRNVGWLRLGGPAEAVRAEAL